MHWEQIFSLDFKAIIRPAKSCILIYILPKEVTICCLSCYGNNTTSCISRSMVREEDT